MNGTKGMIHLTKRLRARAPAEISEEVGIKVIARGARAKISGHAHFTIYHAHF